MKTNCPWFIRWLHRRLRKIDRDMLSSMVLGAGGDAETALVALRIFIAQPGQEHWHCPCASKDTA